MINIARRLKAVSKSLAGAVSQAPLIYVGSFTDFQLANRTDRLETGSRNSQDQNYPHSDIPVSLDA